MNKKFQTLIVFICILCLFPFPSNGQSAKIPEPYKAEEFPQWALDLRRFEIIAFGALPFTLFFSMTAYDTWRYIDHGGDRNYAPWPFKPTGATGMSGDEFAQTLTIACIGAISFSIIDFTITQIKRSKQRKRIEEKPKSGYTIERRLVEEAPETVETLPVPEETVPGEANAGN